jgi:hypothetical protein
MPIRQLINSAFAQLLLVFPVLQFLAAPAYGASADLAQAVQATRPLAYFRLDAPSGHSAVGAATYQSFGGVTAGSGGAPLNEPGSSFLNLDGKDGYVLTTQKGGVATAGSMMAWVNLAQLPDDAHHIVYLEGISESGNDFDVQFEGGNVLRFYTAGGGNIEYKPAPATLVNQWHMVVVTMDTASKARAIYWDGTKVASDAGGGRSGKNAAFSIGASTVFSGRFLKGGVQDAALWNRALSAAEVSQLYAAAMRPPETAAAGTMPAAGTSSSAYQAGPAASSAKVEIEDASGPIALKPEERVALMYLTAMQNIELNCQLTVKAACSLDQLLAGVRGPNGAVIGRLKFDPAIDPNYNYSLASSGMAWEAHATAKRAGLAGFYFYSKGVANVEAHYAASGTAGAIDRTLTSRGISGDSFEAH